MSTINLTGITGDLSDILDELVAIIAKADKVSTTASSMEDRDAADLFSHYCVDMFKRLNHLCVAGMLDSSHVRKLWKSIDDLGTRRDQFEDVTDKNARETLSKLSYELILIRRKLEACLTTIPDFKRAVTV